MHQTNRPLVVAFVDDLFFAPQIGDAARKRGFHIRFVESAENLGPDDPDLEQAPGEPLRGQIGALFDQLTTDIPALLLFDLENKAVPWRDWIARLKSSPATRRIPVLCFGRHTEVDTLARARDAGADHVMARSRFVQLLPELFSKYARLPDAAGLTAACEEALSPSGLRGIELFNAAEYFEAHEALELAWNEDDSPARELYRAILQVAVAYLQIERQNYNGAAKMFLRLQQWINPLPDRCRGVDVAQLRADVRAVRARLKELGPQRIADFDRRLFNLIVHRPAPQ
ncbi:MAG: DUF309 domain-containing protein [Anaerolineales bacterium]